MNFTVEQLGKQLFQEAVKSSSFGSKEKNMEKSYKTKYLLDSWKFGTNLKLIRNCYDDVYSEYLSKVREIEKTNDAAKAAAFQAIEASINAKKAEEMAKSSLNNYYYDLESKLYDIKQKKNKMKNRMKKRKNSQNSINSFRKRRKYNLTVETNFKDWSNFTDYVKNEKDKMRNNNLSNKGININKKHFKDWNEFTQHLKTSSF